jgi:chromosome segregation and condensation protein ScpB
MRLVIKDTINVYNHMEHIATVSWLFVEVHHPVTVEELEQILSIAKNYELIKNSQHENQI